MLVNITGVRISEQALVNKYESKYSNVTQKIEEAKREREVKETTIKKLELLRGQYINQYGGDSNIVKDINKDIADLQK
jgi:hypothetical protein